MLGRPSGRKHKLVPLVRPLSVVLPMRLGLAAVALAVPALLPLLCGLARGLLKVARLAWIVKCRPVLGRGGEVVEHRV